MIACKHGQESKIWQGTGQPHGAEGGADEKQRHGGEAGRLFCGSSFAVAIMAGAAGLDGQPDPGRKKEGAGNQFRPIEIQCEDAVMTASSSCEAHAVILM